jgi:sporulation protein YlmC with PRC-barrel domain
MSGHLRAGRSTLAVQTSGREPPEGVAAVADETELTIGARAHCSDGLCGKVIRIVIDPATRTVTHLAVEPNHHFERARLVPLDLADATGSEISLRCTLAEFGNLDSAEEVQMVDDIAPADLGPVDLASPLATAGPMEVAVEDVVPPGETEVRRGEYVHAVDGEIGRLQGVIIGGDHRLTHVLLKEGHLWGRKEVAIPVSAVADVMDGIVLNITKKQVEDLPALRH